MPNQPKKISYLVKINCHRTWSQSTTRYLHSNIEDAKPDETSKLDKCILFILTMYVFESYFEEATWSQSSVNQEMSTSKLFLQKAFFFAFVVFFIFLLMAIQLNQIWATTFMIHILKYKLCNFYYIHILFRYLQLYLKLYKSLF